MTKKTSRGKNQPQTGDSQLDAIAFMYRYDGVAQELPLSAASTAQDAEPSNPSLNTRQEGVTEDVRQ